MLFYCWCYKITRLTMLTPMECQGFWIGGEYEEGRKKAGISSSMKFMAKIKIRWVSPVGNRVPVEKGVWNFQTLLPLSNILGLIPTQLLLELHLKGRLLDLTAKHRLEWEWLSVTNSSFTVKSYSPFSALLKRQALSTKNRLWQILQHRRLDTRHTRLNFTQCHSGYFQHNDS